jgi:hypothetical protein
MLARFLVAAVLLAGCSAPVTRPSVSHSGDFESTRQSPPFARGELSDNPVVGRTPDGVCYHRLDTMDWSWTDQLPNSKAGCIIGLVIIAVIVIATATVWR